MSGILYGIGVGPGDPELLTFKAVRAIQESQVIAVPDSGSGEHLALSIIKEYIKDQELLYCDLPMTRDSDEVERCHAAATDELCKRLRGNKNIAFLTLGDPTIYATYGYLHKRVLAAGFMAEIIPGIPSFCATAAALDCSLCSDDEPLIILPASYAHLEQAILYPGTRVLMKMGKQRDKVLKLLEEKGLLGNTMMVERCTMPGEMVFKDMEQAPDGAGYFATLVVKGE